MLHNHAHRHGPGHGHLHDHDGHGHGHGHSHTRDHIRRLLPLTRQILTEANLQIRDIGAIAYTEGPGLAGHSDADVVAHAVADALLGPTGLPDLGTLFPADDDTYREAWSMGLLGEVADLVQEAGWWLVNVNVVVAAERPRLAPHVSAMASNLVRALDALTAGVDDEADTVTVRPKFAEGVGAVGRGEGIAAWAISLLERG